MLLSEILNISKKLKSLNESYKSKTIKEIINDVNKSSMLKHNSSYSTSLYDTLHRYLNNLSRKYMTLEEIVSYMNLPEYREKLFPKDYSKGTYSTPFIVSINKLLQSYGNKAIDIANINESDLITLYDPNEAKKKIYKQGLQFWVDSERRLRAITYNNKILCIVKPLSTFHSGFVSVNKNYIGHLTEVDVEPLLNNTEKYKEFAYNAFNIIPEYKIYTLEKDIRNELNCVGISMLKLIEYLQYSNPTIYCITSDAMDEHNISEKLISRAEYKKFANEQLRFLEIQRRRYKQTIDDIKNKRNSESLETKIPDLLSKWIEYLTKVNNTQLQFIQDPNFDDVLENARYGRYIRANSQLSSYNVGRLVYKDTETINRRKYFVYKAQIQNKYDILLYTSINVDVFIKKLTDILNIYNQISLTENSDQISLKLLYITNAVVNYNNYVKAEKPTLISTFNTSTNVDIQLLKTEFEQLSNIIL